MADGTRTEGSRDSPLSRSVAAAGQLDLDRIYSYGIVSVRAIIVFIAVYLGSVRGAEYALDRHFRSLVEQAVQITELSSPVAYQISSQLDDQVLNSRWVRFGGVKVSVIVLGSDAQTFIYVDGRVVPPPPSLDPEALMRDAARLLPATAEVVISLPHSSLLSAAFLVVYATLLLQFLYVYNRRVARREQGRLDEVLRGREETARRAEAIREELNSVRRRLLEVEPSERKHVDEIAQLQREREALRDRISNLAAREEELRSSAVRVVELDQERQALEELLEEAGSDMTTKDDEIRNLEQKLKRASRSSGAAGGRVRGSEQLARRLRTLYKSLEIDDRAIDDVIALRDETRKLKAEESLKRLDDEAENVSVRRKVGGLPPHLTIFELGFGGKGRIYYTRGRQRRFRVLTVGAKNTQKTDLEYLSRLTR